MYNFYRNTNLILSDCVLTTSNRKEKDQPDGRFSSRTACWNHEDSADAELRAAGKTGHWKSMEQVMIQSLIHKNRKSYLSYLSVVFAALIIAFVFISTICLQQAEDLKITSLTGTADISIVTDLPEHVPDEIQKHMEVLSQSRNVAVENGYLLISWRDGFDGLNMELREGELPDAHGEVSVDLNTALRENWHTGMVLKSSQTHAGEDLTITSIHNDTTGMPGLLAYDDDISRHSTTLSNWVILARLDDADLARDIFLHPEKYTGVQMNQYGIRRWNLNGSGNGFLYSVIALCLLAGLVLLVLNARSFVDHIIPDLDDSGVSVRAQRRILFQLLFVVPSLLVLGVCLLLVLVEFVLWKALGVEHWMHEAGISLWAIFLILWVSSELGLVISTLVLWRQSRVVPPVPAALEKNESAHSALLSMKNPASSLLDWKILLVISVLTLCIPCIVQEGGQRLIIRELHPLNELMDKDLRLNLVLSDLEDEQVQVVYEEVSAWSAQTGRAGYLDFQSAVPLRNSILATSDTVLTGSDVFCADLTVPLDQDVFDSLTKGISMNEDTRIVYCLSAQDRPMNRVTLVQSSENQSKPIQLDLDDEEIALKSNSPYLMVLMNPRTFDASELSPSFGTIRLSLAWDFEAGTTTDQEIKEAEDLISRWNPLLSQIFLTRESRLSNLRYRLTVFWISVISLMVVLLLLQYFQIRLYRQKAELLQKEKARDRVQGQNLKNINRQIRSTQIEQILIAGIPSVIIGCLFWIIQASPIWLIAALTTEGFCGMAAAFAPLWKTDPRKQTEVSSSQS